MTFVRDIFAFALAAAALAGCQAMGEAGPPAARPAVVVEAAEGWRSIALPQHASISEDLPGLFRRAAASARPAVADRALLDPNLSLPRPAPTPGPYRCRIVRLGPSAPASRPRRASAREGFCYVTVVGQQMSLTLETPARPIGGFLWETSQSDRFVFLGAEIAPRTRTAPAYGDPGAVSTAGLFERIGDFRYRLVVRGPQPGTVDAYELVAAPDPR